MRLTEFFCIFYFNKYFKWLSWRVLNIISVTVDDFKLVQIIIPWQKLETTSDLTSGICRSSAPVVGTEIESDETDKKLIKWTETQQRILASRIRLQPAV